MASIGLAASITRAGYIIKMFDTQFDPNTDYRPVNLPSLSAYVTQYALVPPTKFLASVRSFISLRCNQSSPRDQSTQEVVKPDNQTEISSTSMAKVYATDNNKVEVYAMQDLEAQEQHIVAPGGAIVVDSQVSQTRHDKAEQEQISQQLYPFAEGVTGHRFFLEESMLYILVPCADQHL
ncbi:hypothetical protein SBOR_7528 [Sclerotinia borealis F-4128]|uniref:Uncharacterized protein n=1 Tax=Sclerotinia borealis (strain F-4128) TaxID=1432307 RepID=W9C891_SCLBF|nr:hypothetical protein SBOR_7528 [Sclerotinia borealis F-4128]